MKSLISGLVFSRGFSSYRKILLLDKSLRVIPSMMASRSIADGPFRVAVTQMTAVSDKEVNISTCETLVRKAAAGGAQMVFLPEACDYIAETKEDSINMAESLQGPLVSRYRNLAATSGVWLSLGGLHIKEPDENKVSNTHVVIDDKGEIQSTYKKTHLFSVHIPEKNLHLEESTYITKGEGIYPPVLTPVGKVALAICYDMRFPELSLIQRKMGAQILTFPSAFTVTTGLAHWEAILRVRAIETQCYVIAAAQTGQHNKKRSSYGHALIVDPWGKVLCEIPDGTDVALADVDLNYVEKIRKDMPVLSHRRSDLYRLYDLSTSDSFRLCNLLPLPSPYASYQFGSVNVPGSCIFLKSSLSQAFVNKKPITPGHVLVTPERPAKRFRDLTLSEICDLVQLMQLSLEVIIKEYEPESLQIALQDGPAAGQTIEHVHFHIVPMSSSIREKLQNHETIAKWRDTSEMEDEAKQLRQVALNSSVLTAKSVFFQQLEVIEPTFQNVSSDARLDIPDEFLIAKTRHSCAFIAPQPVLHGHICVASIQPKTTLREVSTDILTDLFLLVQLVQNKVEHIQSTESSTIFILQELQTDDAQHLQVHIVPRKDGDFPDCDDIYSAIKNYNLKAIKWMDSEYTTLVAEKLRKAVCESV